MYIPKIRIQALAVWRRNFKVWRKLIVPSLLINFGEPLIYLFGLGFGLGSFVGEVQNMSYLSFLASGIIASSGMNTASFEGTYSVFTRMVPQRTYRSMLSAPVDVDDIVLGEFLWCATKSVLSGSAILGVAALLGAVSLQGAFIVIPLIFLTGLAFAGPAILISSFSRSYDFFQLLHDFRYYPNDVAVWSVFILSRLCPNPSTLSLKSCLLLMLWQWYGRQQLV